MPEPGSAGERTEAQRVYEAVASQIDREDTLVSIRMRWLLTSQGFLFAAIGLLSQAREPASDEGIGSDPSVVGEAASGFLDAEFVTSVRVGVLAVGAAIAFYAHGAIAGAFRQLSQLKLRWQSEAMRSNQRLARQFPSILHYPRPFGDPDAHKPAFHYARALPIIMFAVWVVLALVEGTRHQQLRPWVLIGVSVCGIGCMLRFVTVGRTTSAVVQRTTISDDMLDPRASRNGRRTYVVFKQTVAAEANHATFGMEQVYGANPDTPQSKAIARLVGATDVIGWASPSKDATVKIGGWADPFARYRPVRLHRNAQLSHHPNDQSGRTLCEMAWRGAGMTVRRVESAIAQAEDSIRWFQIRRRLQAKKVKKDHRRVCSAPSCRLRQVDETRHLFGPPFTPST